MRIFGFEITRSRTLTGVDATVWNIHGQPAVQLGSMSADELRFELAAVHLLAKTGRGYYIREGDPKQQLQVRNLENLVRRETRDPLF